MEPCDLPQCVGGVRARTQQSLVAQLPRVLAAAAAERRRRRLVWPGGLRRLRQPDGRRRRHCPTPGRPTPQLRGGHPP